MSKTTAKSKYFWNLIGCSMNAVLSIVLLLTVNRIIGEEGGGVFSFVWANAQVLQYIALFEVRPYQVTDVNKKFAFSAYFTLRVCSCLAMLLVGAGYVAFTGFAYEKKMVIAILCVYKALEAFSDVFAAAYQQHDRVDLSGKNMSFRTAVVMIAFAVTMLLTKSLWCASLSMCLAVCVSFILFDGFVYKRFEDMSIRWDFLGARRIAYTVLPLAVASVVRAFLVNVPKYVIDRKLDDVAQNRYGILFMPAMVINLFSMFLFYPKLTEMTEDWNGFRFRKLFKDIRKIVLILTGATLLCVVAAMAIGIPILEWIFGADLKAERSTIGVLMLYGGLNAIEILLYYVIVAVRKQLVPLIVYPIVSLLLTMVLPGVVERYELLGASVALTGAFLLVVMIFGVFLFILFCKNKDKETEVSV